MTDEIEPETTIEDDIREILRAITRNTKATMSVITSLSLLATHDFQSKEYAAILDDACEEVLELYVDFCEEA
jgi:hypothetical protein